MGQDKQLGLNMKLRKLIEITTSVATGPEVVRLASTDYIHPETSRLGTIIRRPFPGMEFLKKKKKKKKKEK